MSGEVLSRRRYRQAYASGICVTIDEGHSTGGVGQVGAESAPWRSRYSVSSQRSYAYSIIKYDLMVVYCMSVICNVMVYIEVRGSTRTLR